MLCSYIPPHVSALSHPLVHKSEPGILFDVGSLLCSVMLFSWEICCNKAASSVFKPYVVKDIWLQLLPNSFKMQQPDNFISTQKV